MTVGTAEIDQARAGVRIAFVTPTWDTAHEELERLAEIAGEDAVILRTRNFPAVTYGDGGELRIISAGSDAEHGQTFDVVIVRADAMDDSIVDRYAPTVATTNGTITIDGETVTDLEGELSDGGVIVCPECGVHLSDNNPGATIRHEADGGHAYQQ